MVDSPKKILVLNMTRLGDILQSTPLLKALKAKDPGAEISYFAVSGFAPVCEHIPEIDRLIPFDFSAAIAISKEAIRLLPRRLKELDELIEALKHENFDAVYNLSHSNISALISHLLDVESTRGLTLDSEGYRRIAHPWARYFFTANLNRHYNRFNQVDIDLGLAQDVDEFCDGSGEADSPFHKNPLSFQVTDEAESEARDLLSGWSHVDAPLIIGLQPGASLRCKMWPAESFTQLGRMLQEKMGAGLVIFGSKSEVDLASEVSGPPGDAALNLAGKTDIGTLGALLRRMDLLISNDTGTQHLAAAVGAPVLSLCFGSALSHETGPYGRNHVVMEAALPCYPCSFHVECNHYRCQQVVTPAAVFEVARTMLTAEPGKKKLSGDGSLFDQINVWRTDFDADNFWWLRPLIPKRLQATDYISLCSRLIWQEVLAAHPAEQPLAEDVDVSRISAYLNDCLPPELDTFERETAEPRKALARLMELAGSGLSNCKALEMTVTESALDLEKIRSAGEELDKIDREITLMGFRLPAVNHLVLDFNFLKQNLENGDLAELSRRTGRLYQRLTSLASRLKASLEYLPANITTIAWFDTDAAVRSSRVSKKSISSAAWRRIPERSVSEAV